MKKSAFILLFLLASLPALMSRGAEAGAAAASDLRQTVKNSSISAQHHDLSPSVASFRPDAHRPLPSHSADYLKFGILVI